jgi:hypothetical protein
MSNLSFARIMYGASQENPAPLIYQALKFSAPLSAASAGSSSASSDPLSDSRSESLLHKAWHALLRHN